MDDRVQDMWKCPWTYFNKSSSSRIRCWKRRASNRIPSLEMTVRKFDGRPKLLRTAKRPLLLAGGGVIAAEAWNELVEVCRAAAGARADGSDGKGAIPADHPLCGGVTFTWVTADLQNMEKSVSPLVIMADAALAVGFRFSQLATVNYTLQVPKSLVQIDADPAEFGANYEVMVSIRSDARVALG